MLCYPELKKMTLMSSCKCKSTACVLLTLFLGCGRHKAWAAYYNSFLAGSCYGWPNCGPTAHLPHAGWQGNAVSNKLSWPQGPHTAGATDEAAVARWHERLADAPLLQQLPLDLPRPALPGRRCGTVSAQLPAALAAAVRGVAEDEGASLFDALLAAWQVLLRQYLRAEEVVTGALLTSCSPDDPASLNGASASLVPIRTSVTGEETGVCAHLL